MSRKTVASSKSASHELHGLADVCSLTDIFALKGKDLEAFGFARARDLAYDAVQELWARRKAEGWTQVEFAEKLGRDTGWLCKKLQGPGNWTFKTFGALVQGLDGDLEIKVHAAEDAHFPLLNYHAYIEFGDAPAEHFAETANTQFVKLIEPSLLLNRFVVLKDDETVEDDTTRREDDGGKEQENTGRIEFLEAGNAL